jgi:hypothetical protein
MTFFLRGLFVAVIGEMQSNKLYLAETAQILFFLPTFSVKGKGYFN